MEPEALFGARTPKRASDRGRARNAGRMRLGQIALAVTLVAAAWTPAHGQVADHEIHSFVMFEQLEQRSTAGSPTLAWDEIGWIGGDFNRLWLRSTGALTTSGGANDHAGVEALFGRLVAPFWDALVGARLDTRVTDAKRQTRTSAVVALEGLAPYWFELEPSLIVSDRGDVSAELTAAYELFVTQRLIAEPRLDLRAAVQDVPAFGVGSGVNDAGLGVRLRYEVRRKFAPYIGFQWNRRFAGTADLARAAGEPVGSTTFVAGLRAWF